jgi:2-oxoisovalerate dehydrogenase E1 component beta subunit
MVHLALEAAELLGKEGIDLEGSGPSHLDPPRQGDDVRIGAQNQQGRPSARGQQNGGIGAEISALLAEDCFDSLDGPILRIAPPDTPVPFSTPLEEFFLPKVSDIVAGAKKLAAY